MIDRKHPLLIPLSVLCVAASSARAQTLVFGNSSAVTSIDPHFYTATPNLEVSKQIFDGLTQTDADGHVRPGLAESWRLVALDSARDRTPFVTGPDGEPLERNLLRDAQVRRALSLAVDRSAIADRIMQGAALPTAQVVREGLVGYDPDLKPEFEPGKARTLLAEAGYPKGFRITLHGPNGRYLNDAVVLQAIGQMWQRVGVKTTVEALPWASMASRASHQAFSAVLFGGTAATNDASYPLHSIVETYNPARGNGMSNNTRYSNPTFDAAVERALHATDDVARGGLLREAMNIAAADTAIVPLYIQKVTWAMRAALEYAPRVDEATHVSAVRPR